MCDFRVILARTQSNVDAAFEGPSLTGHRSYSSFFFFLFLLEETTFSVYKHDRWPVLTGIEESHLMSGFCFFVKGFNISFKNRNSKYRNESPMERILRIFVHVIGFERTFPFSKRILNFLSFLDQFLEIQA